jgi:protein phosphatase 2C family protein 2/3
MDSGEESDETTTNEPEPMPVPKPDEDTMPPKGSKPEQLHQEPGGDAYPDVAKVEGLMDKSDENMA